MSWCRTKPSHRFTDVIAELLEADDLLLRLHFSREFRHVYSVDGYGALVIERERWGIKISLDAEEGDALISAEFCYPSWLCMSIAKDGKERRRYSDDRGRLVIDRKFDQYADPILEQWAQETALLRLNETSQIKDRTTVEVINIRDRKPGDIYIGRAGKGEDGYFGNPHPVGKKCPLCGTTHTRSEAIKVFKTTFWERIHSDQEYRRRILELKGKRLSCFCKPEKACHGDVIKAWFDAGCPV